MPSFQTIIFKFIGRRVRVHLIMRKKLTDTGADTILFFKQAYKQNNLSMAYYQIVCVVMPQAGKIEQ